MNYLKYRKTYANSSRSHYRYAEPNTKFSNVTDVSDEEDEVDEPNNCLISIDSGVSDPEVSQNYEQVQNRYYMVDKNYPEPPDKQLIPRLIHNNNKEKYEDLLVNSHINGAIHPPKNLQMPLRSKEKSPNNFGKNTCFNNTVISPNSTTDVTEAVQTSRIFHRQNNAHEDTPKSIQTKVALQSSKNVQIPIESQHESTKFISTFTFSNNTVRSPNATTDTTEAVQTARVFHCQNNAHEDTAKIIQKKVFIQSSKIVQLPIESRQESTKFNSTFTFSNNTVTSPNASTHPTEAVQTAKEFHDQNNAHENTPKIIQKKVVLQSSKNVQAPIESKQKSTNFIRTLNFLNNSVTSRNSTSVPSDTVPTAKLFLDQNTQNNNYEEVESISQTNAAIQSSKNVQSPTRRTSLTELTAIESSAIVFQPSKKVQESIISKNQSNFFKQNTSSASESDGSKSSFMDALAIQSPKNADAPITSFNFNREISQSVTGIANKTCTETSPKNAEAPITSLNFNREDSQSETDIAIKTSTDTFQSPESVLKNVKGPIEPKIKSTNLRIQIKGHERTFLSEPQLSTLDLPQPSQQTTGIKPFAKKRTFKKRTLLVNLKDLSRFRKSCAAQEDTTGLKINDIFKMPLKKPPFKPEWQTSVTQNSVPVEVSGSKPEEDEDTIDLATMIMRSNIESDGDDIADGTFLDENLSTYEGGTSIFEDGICVYEDNSDTLERVNHWVTKQEVPIDRRRIPSIFKNICYNHFFHGITCNDRCKNRHDLKYHFDKQCFNNMTLLELKNGLSFAIEIPPFYEKVWPILADMFGRRDNKEGLIYMVHQIFKNNFPTNQVDALKLVLSNLQKTDLGTLKESIEYVLMQVCFKSYVSFGAALVEIMISSKDVLIYWPIMRRMITGGLTLSGLLATEFLKVLAKSAGDSNVCCEAYNLISKYKFLELALIPSNTRDQFLLLAKPPNRALEEKTRNNLVSSSYHSAFPQQVPKFNGPYNSSTSYQNSTAVSRNELGWNSTNIDYASLCQREQLTSGASRSNGDDGRYWVKQHGYDYRDPSRRPNRSNINIDGRQSNFHRPSCDDSPHSREDLRTIPSGNRFPNRSDLTYNTEGFENHPHGDYSEDSSTSKRKHQEFDRLLNNDSEPPQKKFQLNASRLAPGLQKNNILDESSTGIPAARPRQHLEYPKPPSEPVFGKLCLNPDYRFEVSLHNLYVQDIGEAFMDEKDVSLLDGIFANGNGKEFLRLIKKYQDPLTVRSFISQSLTHLKLTAKSVITNWMRVLDSMARANPNYYGSGKIRTIIEVITMNLLFFLPQYSLWSDAKSILMRFPDWDSLVTSRIFTIDVEAKLSILGRYLFIAKLLRHIEPKLSYKILTYPEFKFIENQDLWPYNRKQTSSIDRANDLKSRNILLTHLLGESYLHDIEVVTDIYKLALSSGIWEFEVVRFINPMINKLLADKQIAALEHVYRKLNVIFEYIDTSFMRPFLILMFSHLPVSDGFKIFEMCISHALYDEICENDILKEDIVVDASYSHREIEIIIKYCFHKLVEIRYVPSSGFKFWIKFSTNIGEGAREGVNKAIPYIIKKKNLISAKNKVMDVLDKFYQLRGRTTSEIDVIEVAKDDLISFLEKQ